MNVLPQNSIGLLGVDDTAIGSEDITEILPMEKSESPATETARTGQNVQPIGGGQAFDSTF